MKKTLLFLLIFTIGCTDAVWDKFATIGRKAEIKCFSGDTMIFWAISTGKVSNDKDSINEPFILGSEPYSDNINIIDGLENFDNNTISGTGGLLN